MLVLSRVASRKILIGTGVRIVVDRVYASEVWFTIEDDQQHVDEPHIVSVGRRIEYMMADGRLLEIKISRVQGCRAHFALHAPRDLRIDREENVAQAIHAASQSTNVGM